MIQTVRVEEEVLLLDIAVVDMTTLFERGQELLHARGGWRYAAELRRQGDMGQ